MRGARKGAWRRSRHRWSVLEPPTCYLHRGRAQRPARILKAVEGSKISIGWHLGRSAWRGGSLYSVLWACEGSMRIALPGRSLLLTWRLGRSDSEWLHMLEGILPSPSSHSSLQQTLSGSRGSDFASRTWAWTTKLFAHDECMERPCSGFVRTS